MMPMSSPGWFNDLPEYMTEAEYRDLSELEQPVRLSLPIADLVTA
jgi:hypothetical protein